MNINIHIHIHIHIIIRININAYSICCSCHDESTTSIIYGSTKAMQAVAFPLQDR